MCKPRKTSYNREILEKQEKRDKEMFLGLKKVSPSHGITSGGAIVNFKEFDKEMKRQHEERRLLENSDD